LSEEGEMPAMLNPLLHQKAKAAAGACPPRQKSCASTDAGYPKAAEPHLLQPAPRLAPDFPSEGRLKVSPAGRRLAEQKRA